MSESRQLLLRLIAEQAESASPERAQALEDLSSAIEERPPFWVDVLRPEMLRRPAVAELLDGYGTDAAEPERFVQALGYALPVPPPIGWSGSREGRMLAFGRNSPVEVLLERTFDLLLAGARWLGYRATRW